MEREQTPTLHWFRSLTAITDAINALEAQCAGCGFAAVVEKLRAANMAIAAAAEIIQSRAYEELAAGNALDDSGRTKH